MSRIDTMIDELEQRLASLTPDEQRDLAELLGRAARLGVTAEIAALAFVDLSRCLSRCLSPRPDQECYPPERRAPWWIRCAHRWPCLALPPRFGEGFCVAPLKVSRDLPI